MTEWFCHVTCFAKVFLLLLFFLKHDIFITHQVRCYHFFISEIIVESVNLIQMSNRIESFIWRTCPEGNRTIAPRIIAPGQLPPGQLPPR